MGDFEILHVANLICFSLFFFPMTREFGERFSKKIFGGTQKCISLVGEPCMPITF